MFVELEALLKSCGGLKLALKMKGDAMAVVVMPEGEAKDTALRQPLVMTATAAELDAGFAEHLATYTGAHVSLAEQVAATTAILGEAQKAQVTKATKALSGKAGRSTQAAATGAPDGDAGDDDSESSVSDAPAAGNEGKTDAPAAAEPVSSGTDLASLF
ncbi:PRTRC system protein E [Paraburkholderia sp. MMS20-SJTR3]|uniref:PRTRC system protein E n=1 Tax=Paraburkholderia sejongensis TaxID=2886946 RepID=A0ABS8K554_9BURK|nr:PRTRC system protein E [Paraburkholderia sp. MMS20-SJTR3]MCC8397286.1 PRTRC system protein E [Paraburkholderia sp. MMS20-SJTR3]